MKKVMLGLKVRILSSEENLIFFSHESTSTFVLFYRVEINLNLTWVLVGLS